MPHVFVQHTSFPAGSLSRLFNRFPEAVLPRMAELLSVGEWPLTEKDFSLTFRQKTTYELLTAHFQVLVFAHSFPERDSDDISIGVAGAVKSWVEDTEWRPSYQKEPISISVSMILADIGYCTATAFPPAR